MTDSTSRKFAEETGIHGVLPFMVARNKIERLIWFLVLLTAIGLITKGCYRTVLEYVHQPTVTKLSFTMPKNFPEILVCDPHWISEAKLKARGWGIDEFRAIGMMFMHPLFFTHEDLWAEDFEDWMKNRGSQAVEKIFGNPNETMAELIRSIAFNASELVEGIDYQDYRNETNVEAKMMITGKGPCVRISTNNIELSPLFADDTKVYVEFGRLPAAFNMTHRQGMYLELFVAPNVETTWPEGPFSVGRGRATDVKMQGMKEKRVTGCDARAHNRFGTCKARVAGFFCEELGSAPFFAGQKKITAKETSNYLRDTVDTYCDLKRSLPNGTNIFDALSKHCQRPCEAWRFTMTATPLQDTGSTAALHSRSDPANGDIFSFSLLHSTRSIFIEELYTMTTDTFLSNLGGQISLWSGASMITIIHILLFFMCRREAAKTKTMVTFDD